jgi:hypothetical protein
LFEEPISGMAMALGRALISRPASPAIARALIDHPRRTLNALEMDAVIAPVLVAQARSRRTQAPGRLALGRKERGKFSVGLEG